MAVKFIIGISGGSGSGKTSFINELRRDFDELDVCVVSQDDYYKERNLQKKDENGIINFDLPGSIEDGELIRDLHQLKSGNAVERTEYTFNNSLKEADTKLFYPAKILIIEGLFIYHFAEIRELIDLKILIDAKTSSKIIRRIKRDQNERNYPIDDVLYRYEKHVMPAYEQFIEPFKDQVDIIVNNNQSFDKGLDVVKGYINFLLNKS
ncbi:MAG: uridine kinase [Saprospiraceae bacterium]|nr:uridine kinase [Saprospiraceae bacterium]MCB9328645.1 uridine kinase [Lewinellaceae bacterium]